VLISGSLFAQAKSISIGEQTFVFNDTVRKRVLKTEIWHPSNDKKSRPGITFHLSQSHR